MPRHAGGDGAGEGLEEDREKALICWKRWTRGGFPRALRCDSSGIRKKCIPANGSGLQPSDRGDGRDLGRCPRLVWGGPLALRNHQSSILQSSIGVRCAGRGEGGFKRRDAKGRIFSSDIRSGGPPGREAWGGPDRWLARTGSCPPALRGEEGSVSRVLVGSLTAAGCLPKAAAGCAQSKAAVPRVPGAGCKGAEIAILGDVHGRNLVEVGDRGGIYPG
jgi:hypothetical protein